MLAMLVFGQKVYQAQRVKAPILIDGEVDVREWSLQAATDFVQFEPTPGIDPSVMSDVYIQYDDKAIYVGAQLYDGAPDRILKELANRDGGSNTDYFAVAFDTYNDGINAFVFGVTAAGVQRDAKFSSEGDDSSWDAVWESAVDINEKGWSVEMRIPYSALRFAEAEEQDWGVQFIREFRRLREISYWNPVDPATDGFVNQFGKLAGVKDIKPPFRLSVNPYVSGYYDSSFKPGDGSSFQGNPAYAAGADIKLGLSDAFTLDMTLIPDFGQVISDNQVFNLGPFEVFFEENRQFFTEGLELFNKGRLFYTRRVGGRPLKYFSVNSKLQEGEEIIENPSTTSLINATKVSGRLKGGTGIGFFNGITAREFATVKNGATENLRRIETSPLTNYNVLVADQTLKNNSFITLMNTNVTRIGEDYDANTTGFFSSFNDKDQKYGVRLSGSSSNKYTSESNDRGYSYDVFLGKISGNWTYNISHKLETDNYDPNDLGFLFSPNERSYEANVNFNQYKPKNEKLALYRFNFGTGYYGLHRPNAFSSLGIYFNNFWLYKSRDAFGYTFAALPAGENDYFEPRRSDFSTYLHIPASYSFDAFYSSDYRRVFALDVGFEYEKYNENGRYDLFFRFGPRVRFNDHFSIFYNSNIRWNFKNQGFINRFIGSDDVVLSGEDGTLIGSRNRQIWTNTLTGRYIFNNKMGLNLRVRHYWDKVIYNQYYLLQDQGKQYETAIDELNEAGEPRYNVNVNIFNIDLQYQWRFAPGSDIFIVWKNNISDINQDYAENYFSNLSNLFDQFQTNSLSVRVIYFLDYERFF